MISFLSGLIAMGAGVGGVWYCRPRNGEVQRFVVAPVLDWPIPTAIIWALSLGIALIVFGVMS
jgi:hypothetical protein